MEFPEDTAMPAFDYDAQVWIHGTAADTLRRAQLTEDLELIEGPRGQGYLDAIRRRGEPRRLAADVAAGIRKELSLCAK